MTPLSGKSGGPLLCRAKKEKIAEGAIAEVLKSA
jgi:hypothetical protein